MIGWKDSSKLLTVLTVGEEKLQNGRVKSLCWFVANWTVYAKSYHATKLLLCISTPNLLLNCHFLDKISTKNTNFNQVDLSVLTNIVFTLKWPWANLASEFIHSGLFVDTPLRKTTTDEAKNKNYVS